ncbi:IS256 family transposase [Cellulomonas sp. WB94]|nr:IS256 family transposase [Cellulomonas sp. WB94]PVU82756.1 IS256 family transposase [Cellulomonas sp. WB94]
MAMDQSALLDLLAALKDTDVSDRIRTATEHLYQELIDAEATAVIGAGPWQRTQARTALRNGSRDRVLTTTAGDLDLRIPKLRTGSFFPSLLERRRRVDQALFAVVMEAYLHGVSTRKVDDLVRALGADTGISKSEVSRICAGLDEEVSAFRDRSLADAGFPYVFLDATYCKARVGRRVVSQAVVIATGVRADGHREVLGFDVGDSENGAFWTSFLRSLKARGLGGVALVISDAHEGLKTAIASVLLGSSWQRCRVHFTRNVLDAVSKTNAEMVAAAIRTIFAQPDAAHVAEQFEVIATMLTRSHPKVGHMLTDAREDLLAFTAFPASHWKKIWSTNPLERLNKEVKRRTDVVGVFPNPAALLRLAGAVLVEAHDEWAATDRRYLSENSMAQLATMTLT